MRLLMDFVFTGRTWGIFGRAGMVIGTTVSADVATSSSRPQATTIYLEPL